MAKQIWDIDNDQNGPHGGSSMVQPTANMFGGSYAKNQTVRTTTTAESTPQWTAGAEFSKKVMPHRTSPTAGAVTDGSRDGKVNGTNTFTVDQTRKCDMRPINKFSAP